MSSAQPEAVVSSGRPEGVVISRHSDVDARLASAAKVLSGKWNLLILSLLEERPRRFAELMSMLAGISPNILTAKLRALEAAGVVERLHLPLPANCWVYRVADGGGRLKTVLAAMADWIDALSVSANPTSLPD